MKFFFNFLFIIFDVLLVIRHKTIDEKSNSHANRNNSELIQIGAYKRGTDREIDEAINYYPKIRKFLNQDILEYETIDHSIEMLQALFHGGKD